MLPELEKSADGSLTMHIPRALETEDMSTEMWAT